VIHNTLTLILLLHTLLWLHIYFPQCNFRILIQSHYTYIT
jgi:hypothetical protein